MDAKKSVRPVAFLLGKQPAFLVVIQKIGRAPWSAMNYFLPAAFFGDFFAAFLVAGFLVDLAGVFFVVFLAAAIVGSFRGRPKMLQPIPWDTA